MSLSCRADSRLCLNYALGLRNRLADQGVAESDLPKINNMWSLRWRRQHGISIRNSTNIFKVSFAKAVHRVGVMLGNMFRMRALWELSLIHI